MSNRSRRRIHPAHVADYWLARWKGTPLGDVPAGFAQLVVDPGEPPCFRCGWRVPDTYCDTSYRNIWDKANKWLDIAHLCDFSADGVDDVQNVVMLCRACHRTMPPFTDGVDALAWVQDCPTGIARLARLRQWAGDCLAEDHVPSFQEIEDIVTKVLAEREAERDVA